MLGRHRFLLSVAKATGRHAGTMSDVSAVNAVWVAIAVVATPGSLVAGLIIIAFVLGARRLSRHRYIAVAMHVAALLTALTALVIAIHSHGWVTRLDTATTSWLVAHRSVGFDIAASVITDLGSPIATAAAGTICAALLCWRARSTIPGIIVLGTVGAAALASTALKAVVDRPRPPPQWQIVLETDPSFPSGHVTGSAALLGIIAVCVGTARSRTVRAWLASGVVTGVLVIAASRLYLGVHWLTDVAAGAIVAAVFVTIGATVFGALHARFGQYGVPRAAPSPGEAPALTTYAAGRVNRDTRIAADRDGTRCASSRDISEPHLERKP
jgi:undecaprenyl-diphosphatase